MTFIEYCTESERQTLGDWLPSPRERVLPRAIRARKIARFKAPSVFSAEYINDCGRSCDWLYRAKDAQCVPGDLSRFQERLLLDDRMVQRMSLDYPGHWTWKPGREGCLSRVASLWAGWREQNQARMGRLSTLS